MDSFIDQKCTFWKCAKKLGRALPPTLIWTKSKRKHYFLRPVNSWLLHFHLCMSGKFSPSKQKESRGWLSVLHVPLAGRGKVVRPTTTCTASTRIFFNHECLKVHCASSQPGPADTIHVIGVQKTVNPEFRGTPNCLSLALVKSLSVNERVTDITTIGLVLVWCPVLPGVHHFGFYKLIMLLLLLLVQNMAFVSDCNMVRCNWWTEQFLPCHEVLDIATWAKQNIFYNILLATEILTEESNL